MISKELSVRAKNFGTPATLLCVSLILAGCQGENDVTASGASQNATAAPASQFTSESTPTEIAMAALAAIRNNDSEALLGLIAIDKVQSDLKAITGGKKSFQGMVDNAARSAVSAIRSEITFLDEASREVQSETINGDQATVSVVGMRANNPLERRFFFVRERDIWKLVPSHR